MNANDVLKKHQTRNPYTIARLENIILVDEDLGNVYGYYHKVDQQKFIHVNENVPEFFHRYILAHLLYPALNDLKDMQFIKQKASYYFSSKEADSNKFAIELLVDEEELKEEGSYTALMKKYKMTPDDINNLKERLNRLLPSLDFEDQVDHVIRKFKGEEQHGKNNNS